MAFKALSLALAALPLFTCAAPVIETRQDCSKYVLIDTRGTNEAQGPSVAFVGMRNQTLTTVPGGTAYNTVYPAGQDTEGLGGADIVRYINAGLIACPQQKYALLGYSQGAVAVAIALANYTTGSAGYNAIAAALVVGNPTKIANKDVDIDQNGGTTTKQYTGVYTNDPNRAKIPENWYQSGKLLDICYQDDLVCVGLIPTALLNFGANHGKYGSTPSVQSIGAKFLIGKLKA